jgi:hypothetical protein
VKTTRTVCLIIALLLFGCDPLSFRGNSEATNAQVETRYRELSESGTPENILDEYSLDELVKEAPALFGYHVKYKNLHLYSDRPFEQSDAINILIDVHARLADSPIYSDSRDWSAFVCNDTWKEDFYLGGAGRIGGRAYLRAAPHVFFTKANIEEDALISPAGRPIAPPRTFTYYLTHEFTHVLLGQHLGMEQFEGLPQWVFEGYPDFVGLGPSYTAAQAREAYDHRDPRVHGTMAEDYMKYGLMVATFLESNDVETLFADPPDESSFSELF